MHLLYLPALSWVPLGLYLSAALPQFVTNLRRKSASGVSHWMLFLRVSSGMFYIPYLYLCSLPWAYRIVMPIYVGMLAVLAYQGYLYEQDNFVRWRVRGMYQLTGIGALLGLLFAICYPVEVGLFYGWVGISLAFFCEWPQLYHNWKRRSVTGLNYLFLSCIGIGAIIEAAIAYGFGLPRPTLFNALRAASYYILYCWQFFLYSGRFMR